MILIIGASGYIGWYLTRALASRSPRDPIVAAYHSHPAVPEGPTIIAERLDACNREQLRATILGHRPDTIVNLAAATTPDWCETHQDAAFRLNVGIPENLVAVAKEHGARIVHLSTCYVFSGDLPAGSAGYREADVPEPVNRYGTTKLLGERVVHEHPRSIVCRLAHVFGSRLEHHEPNLFTKYFDCLHANRPVAVLGKQDLIKPLYIHDLVDLLVKIIHSPVQSGLFHCAGTESLTKEEFARKICKTWRFDPGLIVPAESSGNRARRPINSCLDNKHVLSTFDVIFHDVGDAMLDIKKNEIQDPFTLPPWSRD